MYNQTWVLGGGGGGGGDNAVNTWVLCHSIWESRNGMKKINHCHRGTELYVHVCTIRPGTNCKVTQ